LRAIAPPEDGAPGYTGVKDVYGAVPLEERCDTLTQKKRPDGMRLRRASATARLRVLGPLGRVEPRRTLNR